MLEDERGDRLATHSIGAERVVLRCRVSGEHGSRVATFDTPPDVPGAKRWLASLRRIDCVEVCRSQAGVRCSLRGVGHRRPVRPVIPLRIGLGLATLGVPLFVKSGEV